MALRAVPQMAIDEAVVEDAKLEAALESRQRSKQEASDARAEFSKADEHAKSLLGQLELGEGPVRIGRFRIEQKTTPARSVSFDTEAKTRIAIALVGDD